MLRSVLILLIFSSILFANGKPNAADKEIIELSLNYEFDNADKILENNFHDGKTIKYHFLYLNIEVLKSIKATEKIPFKSKQAVKDSLNQILIDYTENIIPEYEDKELSIDEKFYLGSLYGLLGRFYGIKKSWMSAFSNGKKGKNYLEEVIEEDSNYVDAYLLLGMMNYYTDSMGGFIEFIVGILGLSGDRNIGLAYLEKVEKKGSINNWQATMILIELYSKIEGNKFASLPLLEKIVNRFPNNTKFKNWLCYEYISLYKPLDAGKLIDQDTNNQISDFVKALYYSDVGDFKKSNELYNNLLDKNGLTWPSVYENSKFIRTLNYFYSNNLKRATESSSELNEHYKRIFEQIIQNPQLSKSIQEFRKVVLLNDEEKIKTYVKQSDIFNDSKQASSAYNFYLGIYFFKTDRFNDAEKYFIKAKKINFNRYAVPTSRYLIHIYNTVTVSVDKVEALLDDIDELDNDGLEFIAHDLEVKYDL